jgi:hypothetical protein
MLLNRGEIRGVVTGILSHLNAYRDAEIDFRSLVRWDTDFFVKLETDINLQINPNYMAGSGLIFSCRDEVYYHYREHPERITIVFSVPMNGMIIPIELMIYVVKTPMDTNFTYTVTNIMNHAVDLDSIPHSNFYKKLIKELSY